MPRAAPSCGTAQSGLEKAGAPSPFLRMMPLEGTIGARLAADRCRWADLTPTSSGGDSASSRDDPFCEAAPARVEDEAAEGNYDGEDPVETYFSCETEAEADEEVALSAPEASSSRDDLPGQEPIQRFSSVRSKDSSEHDGSQSLGNESASSSRTCLPASSEPRVPQWSAGSILHASGQCKPCGFYWRSMGCRAGSECQHCHLCTADDQKQRRRVRKEALKQARKASLAAAAARRE